MISLVAIRVPGRVGIEVLDINEPAQIASLHERLSGREFEMLFVNAGTTSDEQVPIGRVPTEDFVNVMVTNALSPMRVISAATSRTTAQNLCQAHRRD